MDQTVPEAGGHRTAEEIDRDLHHATQSRITYAATTLLADTLGADLASSEIAPYLLQLDPGRLVVDWARLRTDLAAGSGPRFLDRRERALILVAAEICVGRMGGLLGELDAPDIQLVCAALQAGAARSEPQQGGWIPHNGLTTAAEQIADAPAGSAHGRPDLREETDPEAAS